jgi:glycosyltransferase involved in cell wall biosynthesis
MACGLPVITTQPGTEEFAVHERTAEIVNPRDIGSIARGLTRVIEDASYRSLLATNGREVSRQFSWNGAVERMESLLFARQGA